MNMKIIAIFAGLIVIGALIVTTVVLKPEILDEFTISTDTFSGTAASSDSHELSMPVRSIEGVLDIYELQSLKGLKFWFVPDESVSTLSIHFAFRGAGSVNDPEDKQGLAQLVSNTMDEGAGALDSQSFQTELKNNSVRLSFRADRDAYKGSLYTLSENKDKAFELLKLALTQPRFDEKPLSRMRSANIARLRDNLSNPQWRALRLAYDTAFENHPYAKNSGGTISGLRAVTPDDLKVFAKNYIAQDNLVIGIAGDITIQDAQNAVDLIFGDLPKNAHLKQIDRVELKNKTVSVQHTMDIPQTYIQLWHPGIKRQSDLYPVASILNNVFGQSGFGSRLMTSAREERGLTYGIYSSLQHFDQSDILSISTATQNEKAGEMMNVIINEIQNLQKTGISQEELEASKSYMIGSLPLDFTSNPRVSSMLVQLQLEELDIDYLDQYLKAIENVTLQDVNALAKDFITIDQFVGVTVGQPQGLDFSPDKVIVTLPNVE